MTGEVGELGMSEVGKRSEVYVKNEEQRVDSEKRFGE